jgi:hypothetical protein
VFDSYIGFRASGKGTADQRRQKKDEGGRRKDESEFRISSFALHPSSFILSSPWFFLALLAYLAVGFQNPGRQRLEVGGFPSAPLDGRGLG